MLSRVETGEPNAGVGKLAASIVICFYNRPEMLKTAIRSCLVNATRKGLPFEIVVADNSIDGRAQEIVGAFEDEAVTVRRVPAAPPNISVARNAGLKAARANLVAFVDDDLELDPGWLDAFVETLAASGADVAIGPVRAKFLAGPPEWDSQGSRFERVLPFPSGTPIPIVGHRYGGFVVSTASSIWRADRCFTDESPFDKDFGASGGEDLDLFMRLEARGRRVVWCAEAGVREAIPSGRTSFLNQCMRAYSGGQAYAAARIKNAPARLKMILDVSLRGLAQSGMCFLVTIPLAAAAIVSRPARYALAHIILKMLGALGKVFWRRKLGYYHLERSPT